MGNKPIVDRVNYEIKRYSELAARMDELMHEYGLDEKYQAFREAEIKRNCYNQFVKDLKNLIS